MNVHSPKSAKMKFPDWEFRGMPFKRNGKTWIRAKSRTWYHVWYYCFEDDEIHDKAE
jgi:hypothetical protein